MTIPSSPRSLPRIGDIAPDFTAATTHGELRLRDYQGDGWLLLFSHPADFTPVCSTELCELARRGDEFAARGARLLGVSVDSVHAHLAWTQNLQRILETRLPFPLVADSDRRISELYGMIHPRESATVTVRAVFFVDPRHVVRALVYYPLNCGRSVDELLRVLTALQTADEHGVACPVDWRPGDDVIVPPPKTEAEVDDRLALTGVRRADFYLVRRSL